jgi:hypothetical protein
MAWPLVCAIVPPAPMSLLDHLRPRWKHSDPAVRKAAVELLTDDRVLTTVFEHDTNEEVRRAAFDRLNDEDVLAAVAKGGTDLNLRAARRLKSARQIADVVRHAESADVRAFLVSKITDRDILHRVASSDVDLKVRLCAKRRCEVPDRMRDYLRRTLSKLQVAEDKAAAVAEFCGNLDDVCGALIAHDRYRINGVTAEPWASNAGGNLKLAPDTDTTDPTCVEFLAGRCETASRGESNTLERVFYRIKIWRRGTDDFGGAVEEGRYKMSSDTAAWSDSSKSS